MIPIPLSFDCIDTFSVLHPYYKLAYIKLAWGGPDEQAAEIAGGNPYAKDWQDEAKQIVERTVSSTSSCIVIIVVSANEELNRWPSIIKLVQLLLPKGTTIPLLGQLCLNLTSSGNGFSLMMQRKAGHLNFDATLLGCKGMSERTQILSGGGR